MIKYAIIDQNNKVVNVVITPNGQFIHPRGYVVVESDIARVNDIYNPEDGTFSLYGLN